MITFPAGLVPNSASPSMVEFGGLIRPATGAETLNVFRNGNRYRVEMTLAPQTGEARRVVVARLLAAKREGLRVSYPLQGVDQSGGGSLVVNGAGQSGSAIALRSGTPGFTIREGWWLSITRSDGRHYLALLWQIFWCRVRYAATAVRAWPIRWLGEAVNDGLSDRW